MSNDIHSMNIDKSISYGAKLKAAREAIGLEQKDIAAQLRLGEKIIDMLESGHYTLDIPVTFIRGYIRSYSKLLQIPEAEVAAALEPIQRVEIPKEAAPTAKQPIGMLNSHHYMRFSTYAIVATLAGMLGLWWYNHTPAAQQVTIAQEQTLTTIPEVQKSPDNKQVATTDSTNTSTANPNAAAPTASANTEHATTVASAKRVAANHPVARSARDETDNEDATDNNNYTD